MHPLDGSFLKLRRAKYHFEVSNDLVKRMHKRKPHQIVANFTGDGHTRECILRFKQVEELDPNLALLIGDICNNLRSALDHLVWQLWLLHNPSFNGNVYFPIWNDEDDFREKSPKDIGGLSNVQKAAIESLQPYKTGKLALSLLKDVNNSDKHRLIQVVGLLASVRNIRLTIDQSKSVVELLQPLNIPLQVASGSKIKDGAILARIPLNRFGTGAKVRVQSRTIIHYVFEGSNTADGQRIEPSLNAMISEVSRAITLLEPEFAKFGVSTFR